MAQAIGYALYETSSGATGDDQQPDDELLIMPTSAICRRSAFTLKSYLTRMARRRERHRRIADGGPAPAILNAIEDAIKQPGIQTF
ncbi:MAG: hypothetical protein U0X75_18340 [Acidobacteriota bacterium]